MKFALQMKSIETNEIYFISCVMISPQNLLIDKSNEFCSTDGFCILCTLKYILNCLVEHTKQDHHK